MAEVYGEKIMTGAATATQVKLQARTAGALYLIVIVSGLFAEFFVRSAFIDRADPAATAANILNSEMLFRAGVVADLVAAASYLGVTFLLFLLFLRVSGVFATLSLVLGTAGSVVMAANIVNMFAPLMLLKTAASPFLLEAQQGQALAWLRAHAIGYNISALFFGAHLLVLGLLTTWSGFLPRFVGWLLIVAGPAWVIYILAVFLAPPAGAYLFPYVPLLSLVAEATVALWLVFVGVSSVPPDPQMSDSLSASGRGSAPFS